jgi:hypothetical protein
MNLPRIHLTMVCGAAKISPSELVEPLCGLQPKGGQDIFF